MGKYINQIDNVSIGTTFREKCENLKRAGAKEVSGDYFEENLICVVDNIIFAGAAYAYDEGEYEVFHRDDGRPKRWFILENVEKYID